MESFVNITLFIHVLAGSIALLSGLSAILLRNNVKVHRPFGKIYFWCMTIVFFTAIIVSTYKYNIFLFCVAFFTYYSSVTAYRSLKLKKLHIDQKPEWYDWAIEGLFGFMHVAFVLFGVFLFFNGQQEFAIICSVFGVIGLRGNQMNVKRLRGKITQSNYWLIAHIGNMLGSYIGAITAFLVNNNNRWIHLPQFLAWLGPAILLVPLIFYEVNRFKKKGKPVAVKD